MPFIAGPDSLKNFYQLKVNFKCLDFSEQTGYVQNFNLAAVKPKYMYGSETG